MPSAHVDATPQPPAYISFFFFNDTATTEIYTLSLHDALPIYDVTAQDRVERLRREAREDHSQLARRRLGPRRRGGHQAQHEQRAQGRASYHGSLLRIQNWPSLGSSTSRSQSPSRLKARTTSRIARPGNSDTHHALVM